MRDPRTDIERQIEAAFSYRGNVTLTLKNGDSLEAYLFNRDFDPHPKLGKAPFVEIDLPGGERRSYPIGELSSVELSGQDHAQY